MMDKSPFGMGLDNFTRATPITQVPFSKVVYLLKDFSLHFAHFPSQLLYRFLLTVIIIYYCINYDSL